MSKEVHLERTKFCHSGVFEVIWASSTLDVATRLHPPRLVASAADGMQLAAPDAKAGHLMLACLPVRYAPHTTRHALANNSSERLYLHYLDRATRPLAQARIWRTSTQ